LPRHIELFGASGRYFVHPPPGRGKILGPGGILCIPPLGWGKFPGPGGILWMPPLGRGKLLGPGGIFCAPALVWGKYLAHNSIPYDRDTHESLAGLLEIFQHYLTFICLHPLGWEFSLLVGELSCVLPSGGDLPWVNGKSIISPQTNGTFNNASHASGKILARTETTSRLSPVRCSTPDPLECFWPSWTPLGNPLGCHQGPPQ